MHFKILSLTMKFRLKMHQRTRLIPISYAFLSWHSEESVLLYQNTVSLLLKSSKSYFQMQTRQNSAYLSRVLVKQIIKNIISSLFILSSFTDPQLGENFSSCCVQTTIHPYERRVIVHIYKTTRRETLKSRTRHGQAH